MPRRMHKSFDSSNNNSVLYLALLCLLYFLITSNYLFPSTNSKENIDAEEIIYIEISEDGSETVRGFTDNEELKALGVKYSVPRNLESGDRLIVDSQGGHIESISGRKKISLGVPIKINSAGAEDLKAIPGIGNELAERIINYRELNGDFQSIDEIANIEGIGKKKLANIKKSASVD